MADYPQSPTQRPSGWSPEMERQFQVYMAMDPSVRAWRNSFETRFGEQPLGPNDPRGDFNYRYAYAAGEQPAPYALDGGMPHWGSSGKTAGHPTRWMNDFMGQFGVDPNALQPGQVTPDMQRFMYGNIAGAPLSYMPPSWGR